MKETKESKPFALLINDIHASKDNLSDFYSNWNEAIEVANRYGVGEMVIGGDLWQSRSAQTLSTLMAVRQAIKQATAAGLYITIGEGNHCKVDQESLLGYSHIFQGYVSVEVVDDFTIIDMESGISLVVMSYFPENGSFLEKLEEVCKNCDPAKTVLYIHEGINGALSTSSDKELSPSVFEGFLKVLVGHYHDRSVIEPNIEYIGASRQYNFGEDDKKGYTILYTDGTTKFIKNKVNTRYATVEIDVDDLGDDIPEEISEMIEQGYKLKVKINTPSDESVKIDKQKLLDMGISKVEVVNNSPTVDSKAHDFEHKFDKDGIKKEYSRFCLHKEIEDVELGLLYLDKIQ